VVIVTVRGSESVTIAASPDAVWPWIVDLTRHSEWSPKDYSVELVDGEVGTVGARYRSVGWVPPNEKDHVNEVVITEVAPSSRFAFEATDASGTFLNAFTLAAQGDGTLVTSSLEFPEMTGISAVLVPILFPLVGKPDMRKRLALLKSRVETAS
jgi:uncharacterized protein YndB with AHSA1/START domain